MSKTHAARASHAGWQRQGAWPEEAQREAQLESHWEFLCAWGCDWSVCLFFRFHCGVREGFVKGAKVADLLRKMVVRLSPWGVVRRTLSGTAFWP